MKKLVFILAVAIVAVGFLALNCEPEEEPVIDNISIEISGDTLKQDTLGASVNFYFNLRNSSEDDLSVTVDTALTDFPDTVWKVLMCDTFLCYPLPTDTIIAGNGSWDSLHLTFTTGLSGTEGKAMLTVTSGEEVDTQNFILKISP